MKKAEDKVSPDELPIDDLVKVGGDLGINTEALEKSEKMAGDGSGRRFWRFTLCSGARYIATAPELGNVHGRSEAEAAYAIGRHLYGCGVPVPEFFAYDKETGLSVCEDLGDTHLHSVVKLTNWQDQVSTASLKTLYCQAVEVLTKMQCVGSKGFDTSWCWDTTRYDVQLMLERESGYFTRALWQNMLGQETPEGIDREFRLLAEFASKAPSDYFLHRDMQSRNLMVHQGRIRVIDFQGGRFGPLGYDLASLLLDPYAALPVKFQEEVYNHYENELAKYVKVNRDEFRGWYEALRLQRNLQIVGAFAFLGIERQKVFFLEFLLPAVEELTKSIDNLHLKMPVLTDTAKRAKDLLLANDTYSQFSKSLNT